MPEPAAQINDGHITMVIPLGSEMHALITVICGNADWGSLIVRRVASVRYTWTPEWKKNRAKGKRQFQHVLAFMFQ